MNTPTVKILIVDDEKLVAKGFARELESAGFSVDLATSGDDALALFKQQPFDIVFTDFVMPGMNGLELCKQIKKLKPKTQVVLVSGHPEAWAKYAMDFIAAGGLELWLRKPLAPGELSNAATKVLKGQYDVY